MRSRTIREGSVGLLILLGLALLGGLVLWVRGFDLSRRAYRFTVEFPNISGMEVGAPVRYRGVAVGKTVDVVPGANVVAVQLEIQPATLLIPKDALIQVIQTGLIGETYVDITPRVNLPQTVASVNPLSVDCDSTIVICNGDRLQGISGVSFSELIGSITRFTDLFSNPEIVAEIRTLTRNSANAADGVADLSREVSVLSRSVRQELGGLSDAAEEAVDSVGLAADNIALTASKVDELINDNRSALINTLNNINLTAVELQEVASSLDPILNEDSELINNLETLSANAAEASSNLRNLTDTVGNSENLLMLQQTLDSARATFQNAEKITADLDELTGDPSFREDLRNLIDGLNNLVSATEQLQQRTQIAQSLESADSEVTDSEATDSEVEQPDSAVSPEPLASPVRPSTTTSFPSPDPNLYPFPEEDLRSTLIEE